MKITNEAMMLQAAIIAEPREACGVVYGDFAYEVDNIANVGTRFFIMDRVYQTELWEKYGKPDAYWHSHPNGDPNPSEADLNYHPLGARLLIVAGGKVHDHGIRG